MKIPGVEKISKYYGRDKYERFYFFLLDTIGKIPRIITPYLRRIIRFIALPYCYVMLVDWKECQASRKQVAADFLYIFFCLKYFPDNYSRCQLWEKQRDQWKYYYGSNYDPYQRAKLRKLMQPKAYEVLYEDKQVCYQLCQAANLPLPEQYTGIDVADDYQAIVESILRQDPDKRLIIKATSGRAGYDIFLAFMDEDRLLVKNKNGTFPLHQLVITKKSVIQEFISQDERLNKVSSSVNTVRMVTMLTENQKVIVLGAYIRFGVNDSFTDNVSAGGLSATIDIESGYIYNDACSQNGKPYRRHPNSKVEFKGFEIPRWKDVLDLAEKAAVRLPYHRLLGHDIAIGASGPLLLEINSIYDNVGFEQKCGPLLINDEILKWYGYYDLLINHKQKKVYKNLLGQLGKYEKYHLDNVE